MPTTDEDRRVIGQQMLGARLRDRRTTAGLLLAEVAERAGVSQAWLSDIERGRKLPTLALLDALAVTFDTTVTGLLQDLYPWDRGQPPALRPSPAPDGRRGRKMPSRRHPDST